MRVTIATRVTKVARSWRAAVVGLGVVALAGCARADHGEPAATVARASVAADAKGGEARPAAGSLREVRVSLELELRSADGARAALAKLGEIARGAGGFVQVASVGTGEARSHLVLRVPPASLAMVRAACADAGAVALDEETQRDVTDAIADLDARLRAGQVEESRLLALVAERTGSVGDVLAAERALADVRDRIERLEAESRASHGRVELATVDVWMAHPEGAAGEGTVAARLSSAAKDGVRGAGDAALSMATVSLRAGPTAAIFALLAGGLIALVKRWRGRRGIRPLAS
jgi:hypothetical protein